jgi:hypothetical protein
MSVDLKLDKRVWRALVIVCAFGGLYASSAGAKTVTVGQLFTPTFGSCSPGYTALQTGVASGNSYRIPKAGVITSWSFHDGTNTVPDLKLKVGRSAGGRKYKILAEKTAGAQTANAVNTYPAHIPVRAGDLIGVFENGGSCLSITSGAGDTDAEVFSDVPPGTTTRFPDGGDFYKWPVSVKVALDCVVPNLKGETLNTAKKTLKAHSCTLGTVTGPRTGKVKSQRPAAGKTLTPGAKVNVLLG